MLFVDVLLVVVGAAVVVLTLGSALRTVVLPRAVASRLARLVFVVMRRLFLIRAGHAASYERRDSVMAPYAPTSLFVLMAVWLLCVATGYSLIFYGLGVRPVTEAVTLSGSSIFTLGITSADGLARQLVVFTEAGVGLVVLAMLITYLPSIYAAFSRREASVALMDVRGGSPPSGVELLERMWAIGDFNRLGEIWQQWELWFIDVQETHTTFPSLPFFRSPHPDQSWVTAAGAVLDAAALRAAVVRGDRAPDAELCVRAGTICLRHIADFYAIPHDPAPRRGDPISIERVEFDEAYERLARAKVPLKADRELAWHDFAGWRVNYDHVLIALAAMTMAPYAPWSSDRSDGKFRSRLLTKARAPRHAARS